MTSTTVYAIASGKGGVGKTTTTVNLGTVLAGAGHRVAIVDTDLGMANLAGFVNLSPDGPTLHDVLAGEASVADATYEVAERIGAIPSGTELSGFAETDATGLADVIDQLRPEFDYVLLDVGAGVSHESVLPLGIADETILVSTPEPASVQDVRKTVDLVERSGGDIAGLMLTRTRSGDKVSYDEIAARFDLPLLGTIPEDDAARDSVYACTPLVVNTPDAPAAVAYRELAEALEGTASEPDTTGTSPAGSADEDVADEPQTDQPASSSDVSDALADIDDADDSDTADTTAASAADTPEEDIDLSLDDAGTVSAPDTDSGEDAVIEAETEADESDTDSSESPDSDVADGVTIPDAEADADGESLDDDAIPFRGGDSDPDAPRGDEESSVDADDGADEAPVDRSDEDTTDGDDEKEGKGFLGGLF